MTKLIGPSTGGWTQATFAFWFNLVSIPDGTGPHFPSPIDLFSWGDPPSVWFHRDKLAGIRFQDNHGTLGSFSVLGTAAADYKLAPQSSFGG